MSYVPKVGVVLLNYNNYVDTIECLRSLGDITYGNTYVVVVDNHSTNESIAEIMKYRGQCKAAFRIVRCSGNVGFAAGCNVGITTCLHEGCEFVLLLNNDTVVDPGFLEPMTSFWEKNKSRKIGALVGKIHYYNNPERIWHAGGKGLLRLTRCRRIGDGKSTTSYSTHAARVSSFSGAMVLFRCSVFTDIGMLDEAFFFGEEDFEYSHRMKKHGYAIYFVPDSQIWHKVGRTRNFSPAQIYNGYLSRFLLVKKVLPSPLSHLYRTVIGLWLYLTAGMRYRRKQGIQMSHEGFKRLIRRVVADSHTKTKVTESDWLEVNDEFGV